MANQYEIREDNSNKHWPFVVWNLTSNWSVDRFPTREEAQTKIDQLSKPIDMDIDETLNFLLDTYEGKPQVEIAKPAPEEETEFVGAVTHKVGDEIADNDGDVYVVIQPSYYISDADAADFEENWDAQVSVGWHTPARLKSQSTEVIIEQVQAGQAKIVRREGKTCVLFHDEDQVIPLDDLTYSSEMGLYQKSKFPDVRS